MYKYTDVAITLFIFLDVGALVLHVVAGYVSLRIHELYFKN